MTTKTTAGSLIHSLNKGTYEYAQKIGCRQESSHKDYTLIGQKIDRNNGLGWIGILAGLSGTAGIVASCVASLTFLTPNGVIPSNITALWASTAGISGGFAIAGFALAGVLFYQRHQEQKRELSADEMKTILEEEEAHNNHPIVRKNIEQLKKELEPKEKEPPIAWVRIEDYERCV